MRQGAAAAAGWPASARGGAAGAAGAAASLAAGLAALLLAGCAAPAVPPHGLPVIDTRYSAKGQDSRVLFLILHFTDENLDNSLRILTQNQVSSHYLLTDESPPRIYRLVEENRRAWHAGDSHWAGHAMLNASSIGIEIVNPGIVTGADGQRGFAPYPREQIDALLRLVKDIVARHQIAPARILGHSDIAPQRKVDPGPQFPWQRLAEAGLIPWPEAARVAALQAGYQAQLPAVAWFQQALARLGYATPQNGTLDAATGRVLAAFQMKYRPRLFDGLPDAETAALLQALADQAPR